MDGHAQAKAFVICIIPMASMLFQTKHALDVTDGADHLEGWLVGSLAVRLAAKDASNLVGLAGQLATSSLICCAT